jgi:hypothetical protein
VEEKTIAYSEYKKLKKWYDESLKAKDRQIEELKKENALVMKTAISQAQRTRQWEEIAQGIAKKK